MLFCLDLTHLIRTEVPVKPAESSNNIAVMKPISAVEKRQEAPKHREARAANLCHPDLCFNGGVCVESEGKVSCRCVVDLQHACFTKCIIMDRILWAVRLPKYINCIAAWQADGV